MGAAMAVVGRMLAGMVARKRAKEVGWNKDNDN